MKTFVIAGVTVCLMLGMLGCGNADPAPSVPVVPRAGTWGIYELDLTTETVELLHSSAYKIEFLNLNKAGDTLAFAQQFAGSTSENEEICTVNIGGAEFRR